MKNEVGSNYAILRVYEVKVSREDQIGMDALQMKAHDFVHTQVLEASVHEQKMAMVEDEELKMRGERNRTGAAIPHTRCRAQFRSPSGRPRWQ